MEACLLDFGICCVPTTLIALSSAVGLVVKTQNQVPMPIPVLAGTTMSPFKVPLGHPAKANNRKPRKWRKPADKPKHPLSAYNIFFQLERSRLLTASRHGHNVASLPAITVEDVSNLQLHKPKAPRLRRCPVGMESTAVASLPLLPELGFRELAKCVAERWKTLDGPTKALFEERARADELADWNSRQSTTLLPMADRPLPTTVAAATDAKSAMAPSVERNLVTPEKKVNDMGNALHDELTVADGNGECHGLGAESNLQASARRNLSFASGHDGPCTSPPDQSLLFARAMVQASPFRQAADASAFQPPISRRLAQKLVILQQRQLQLQALTRHLANTRQLPGRNWRNSSPYTGSTLLHMEGQYYRDDSHAQVSSNGVIRHHCGALHRPAGFASMVQKAETNALDPLNALTVNPMSLIKADKVDANEPLVL